MLGKLSKIGTIELGDDDVPGVVGTFDVAKNGKYYLVSSCGPDAYGNQVYKAVDNLDILLKDTFVDSLIQVIGRLITERDELAAQLASAVRTKE